MPCPIRPPLATNASLRPRSYERFIFLRPVLPGVEAPAGGGNTASLMSPTRSAAAAELDPTSPQVGSTWRRCSPVARQTWLCPRQPTHPVALLFLLLGLPSHALEQVIKIGFIRQRPFSSMAWYSLQVL
jgi:hypothetical protein